MYLVSLAGLIKNSKFVRSLNYRPYSRHTGWNATDSKAVDFMFTVFFLSLQYLCHYDA